MMAHAWRLAIRIRFAAGEIKTRWGVKNDTRWVSVHFGGVTLCFVDGVDIILVWYAVMVMVTSFLCIPYLPLFVDYVIGYSPPPIKKRRC